MELTFELKYDLKAMTAMAKAVRVGLQEEQDKKSKILGWVVVAIAALALLFSGKLGWTQIVGWVLVACFAAYLIWQDTINSYFALAKLPKGMRTGQWMFREDGYFSNTEAGESDYSYGDIFAILESGDYIILVFHTGQAHIVDGSTVQGGTVDDLRRLLRKNTSLTIQSV